MRKLELHYQILLAMALGTLVGVGLHQAAGAGLVAPELPGQVAHLGKELGGLFLKLLKMVVVPLIVFSLITGVTGMGDVRQLGRLGGRTMLYYVTTSMLAIITGLVMVNLVQPGMVDGQPAGDLLALTASTEDVQAKIAGRGLGEIPQLFPGFGLGEYFGHVGTSFVDGVITTVTDRNPL